MNDYIFISYSSKNHELVRQLTDVLRKNQVAYWKAPESIPAGSNYAKEIPKAIAMCSAVIFLVSKEAQSSIWVEKELDAAVCARKTIIPVQIDKEPLNDMYRFYLNNVQMVSYQPNIDSMWQEILARLSSLQETESEEVPQATEQRMTQQEKRNNAFRINKIPVKCNICGGGLEQVSRGVYRCVSCKKDYYDDFQKVRNYLEENGAAPAVVIARATKVPLGTINHFFKEEHLEIPLNDTVRMKCVECGAPIRTGTVCDKCKAKAFDIEIKKKGNWHSDIWKK